MKAEILMIDQKHYGLFFLDKEEPINNRLKLLTKEELEALIITLKSLIA
jgi:hypothetical protein